jgi:2-polyprenyl-3-methyl-5-hydroxy-6-metoxy-1,4-benzoquinol methylase
METSSDDYTKRLVRLSSKKWKALLRVQEPYRRKLLSYDTGKTLDIGCGIGRLLVNLPKGSIGVDHNVDSIKHCKSLGLKAYTTEEFFLHVQSLESFDTILLAHLLEHLSPVKQRTIFSDYLKYLRPGGKVVIITPQEAGYKSDETHVNFTDIENIREILEDFDLRLVKSSSFPFPRFFGKFFIHNEFHVVGIKG